MVVGAESVEFVHGDDVGEGFERLVADGLHAGEFLLRAGEFGGGEAVAGEGGDFFVEAAADEVHLRGVGADVEGEESGGEAHHLRGADEVGEAEFLADAVEEAGGHVAAGGLDEFEGDAVGAEGVGAEEAGHEDGLLFGFVDDDVVRGIEGRGHGRVGHEEAAFGEAGEEFLHLGADFVRVHVAEDGEDAVAGGEALVAEGEEGVAVEGLDGLGGAVGAQAVGMAGEDGAAHGVAGHAGDLLVLGLEGGDLVELLAGDFLVGEGRAGEDVGEDVESEGEVGLHDLDGDAEAVVAGVGADVSADGLDLVGEGLGVAPGGALDDGAGGKGGDAVGRGGLGELAAAEDGDGVDEGEARVAADEEAEAVGEFGLGDFPRGATRGGAGPRGKGSARIERGDGEAGGREVAGGDAEEVGRFDAGDLAEVFGTEVGVAGEEPAAADVRGAAAGSGEVAELLGEDGLAGLDDLGFGGRGFAVAGDDFQRGRFGVSALVGLAEEVHAEETHLTGHVGVGRDVVDEVAAFAQLEVQRGAASAAQHGGEHVERGGVRVRDRRDVPDERAAAEFRLELLVGFAASDLRGLARDEDRGAGAALGGAEPLSREVEDGGGVHVAGDDEEHVIGHVAGAVVGGEVVAGEAVEDVEVPDDGVPVGALAEGGREHEFGAHAVGVIEAHGEFAADDLLLLCELLLRQGGVQGCVGEEFNRRGRAVRRDIDPVDGAVERGVGVDVAAGFLHRAGDFVGAAFLGALEDHVLEEVREPAAQPGVLVDAARLDPDLDAGHGGGVVGFDEDGEAVGEDAGEGAAAGEGGRGGVRGRQEILHAGRRRCAGVAVSAGLGGHLRLAAGTRGERRGRLGRAEGCEEGFLEVEAILEVLEAVLVRASEDARINEEEDHAADVTSRADAPIGEDREGHGAELLEGEFPEAVEQLGGRDVGGSGARFAAALLRVLERLAQEEVGFPAVAGVAGDHLVEVFLEGRFLHFRAQRPGTSAVASPTARASRQCLIPRPARKAASTNATNRLSCPVSLNIDRT